jgi:hypothetical protein
MSTSPAPPARGAAQGPPRGGNRGSGSACCGLDHEVERLARDGRAEAARLVPPCGRSALTTSAPRSPRSMPAVRPGDESRSSPARGPGQGARVGSRRARGSRMPRSTCCRSTWSSAGAGAAVTGTRESRPGRTGRGLPRPATHRWIERTRMRPASSSKSKMHRGVMTHRGPPRSSPSRRRRAAAREADARDVVHALDKLPPLVVWHHHVLSAEERPVLGLQARPAQPDPGPAVVAHAHAVDVADHVHLHRRAEAEGDAPPGQPSG